MEETEIDFILCNLNYFIEYVNKFQINKKTIPPIYFDLIIWNTVLNILKTSTQNINKYLTKIPDVCNIYIGFESNDIYSQILDFLNKYINTFSISNKCNDTINILKETITDSINIKYKVSRDSSYSINDSYKFSIYKLYVFVLLNHFISIYVSYLQQNDKLFIITNYCDTIKNNKLDIKQLININIAEFETYKTGIVYQHENGINNIISETFIPILKQVSVSVTNDEKLYNIIKSSVVLLYTENKFEDLIFILTKYIEDLKTQKPSLFNSVVIRGGITIRRHYRKKRKFSKKVGK